MHQHHHHPPPTDFGRAFQIGILLNVAFVILETICGFLFGSVSLLADAGHNLSDVFGLALAYFAFNLAKKKPSQRFTYGFGSSTILASTLNGTILLVAVGAISWEAVGRFWNPTAVHGPAIIWVAGIGVVINTATALLFLRGRNHDLNVKGAYLHMVADALVSVGVVLTGVIIWTTSWTWVDPVVSLIIAVVILIGTWGLLRDSVKLLSHGVPENIDLQKVRSYLESLPGIVGVHDLHVWALSTTQTALTVHLVKPVMDNEDDLISEISTALHDQFSIEHSTIQIERDPAECPLLCDDTP